jgi:hypothetical protein
MIRIRDKDQALLIARKLPDSAYAALMHPPVALALADLLAHVADRMTEREPCQFECIHGDHCGVQRRALAVARAVLREPDPSGGATDGP